MRKKLFPKTIRDKMFLEKLKKNLDMIRKLWNLFLFLLKFSNFWTMHEKCSLLLRILSIIVAKSTIKRRFGQIYWRNLKWRASFFVHWKIISLKSFKNALRNSYTVFLILDTAQKLSFSLTHFSQKNFGFLRFSGGIEMWHWT